MSEAHGDRERVFWHSRRGMLELDLVLVPFARSRYTQLDAADRQAYRDLLDCDDTDIFEWLINGETPPLADLARIVERIRANGRADPANTA